MNRPALLLTLTQILLAVWVLAMAFLVHLPWVGQLGLFILAAGTIGTASKGQYGILAAWVGTVLFAASAAFSSMDVFEDYFACMAGLMALVILPGTISLSEVSAKARWRALGVTWILLASFLWLGAAYVKNNAVEFYFALLPALAGLVLCRAWFRLRALGIQTVNTLLLLLTVLPAFDVALRFHARGDMRADPEKYYSFEATQKNPAAYARWTRYYEEQWGRMAKQVFEPAPGNDPNFRLKPDSRGFLFKSPVVINHLGFRGPEISSDKGNAYRIVALGESTTFGCTLKSDDRPWPEALEQIIRERLKTSRPVQVINAGIPVYNIESNLRRLPSQILPLHPDLVISYHGFNGFRLIDETLPPIRAKPPPVAHERPMKLLADLEYAVRLLAYKRRVLPHPAAAPAINVAPLETKFARDYETLIALARTNHFHLALANFSMAVNRESPRPVVEFYRGIYPQVDAAIAANEVHSGIIAQLGATNPDVTIVDTQPHFDGEHDLFIDLVHLTQAGRQRMAETMFDGIRPVLELELSAPDTK